MTNKLRVETSDVKTFVAFRKWGKGFLGPR